MGKFSPIERMFANTNNKQSLETLIVERRRRMVWQLDRGDPVRVFPPTAKAGFLP
jgi:hypothetical protein